MLKKKLIKAVASLGAAVMIVAGAGSVTTITSFAAEHHGPEEYGSLLLTEHLYELVDRRSAVFQSPHQSHQRSNCRQDTEHLRTSQTCVKEIETVGAKTLDEKTTNAVPQEVDAGVVTVKAATLGHK